MNIIIAGVSRSGKTTVAKRISHILNLSFLPFDSVISTLEDLYPQIDIRHYDDNLAFSPKLAVFVNKFFEHLQYENMGMVIDLYQLFPIDFACYFTTQAVKIVYLGYPTLTAHQKLAKIRKAERPQDWTQRTTDEKMLEIIQAYLKETKIMAQQCQDLNLPFFDTGTDFEGGVNAAINYLVHQR